MGESVDVDHGHVHGKALKPRVCQMELGKQCKLAESSATRVKVSFGSDRQSAVLLGQKCPPVLTGRVQCPPVLSV
ncbi:hypothetical protein AVEN_89940-1 [Araneus ventricosus]|uniref:Uncharacterized protein n=1 Tax=Araneus ventricosus TaxID=182803 RepID=A0A4Y2TC47_ARAVE|nr:hypothetical protein AVEN_89940-1 [Araneus ventricosus]